ncbi:hypothetical protein [Paraburkholderia ferrariae]|uniref:Uncharacterized protein n=1 Tax=Paraburkholderia ferrariae TaxID=386056 RepID=A0ABU9RHX8_9BURK
MHNEDQQIVGQEAAATPSDGPKYASSTVGILRYLWSHLDSQIDSVSDEDLRWLSRATEEASLMALNLDKTVSGVAALLAYEIDSKGCRSGSFQPYDLPELLWGIASTVGTIGEMVTIGGEADFALRRRCEDRAERLAHQLSVRTAQNLRADDGLQLAAQAQATRSRKQVVATEREIENA